MYLKQLHVCCLCFHWNSFFLLLAGSSFARGCCFSSVSVRSCGSSARTWLAWHFPRCSSNFAFGNVKWNQHLSVFWKFVANFKVFRRRNVNYVALSELKKYLRVFQSRGSNERRLAIITLKCTFKKLSEFHHSSSFLSKEETFKDNNLYKYKLSYIFCTPAWHLQKLHWLRELLKQSVRFYRTSEVQFLARKKHDIYDLSVKVPGSNLCSDWQRNWTFTSQGCYQHIILAGTESDLSLSFGADLHCLNTHWVTITCLCDPLSMALLRLKWNDFVWSGRAPTEDQCSSWEQPGAWRPAGVFRFKYVQRPEYCSLPCQVSVLFAWWWLFWWVLDT